MQIIGSILKLQTDKIFYKPVTDILKLDSIALSKYISEIQVN